MNGTIYALTDSAGTIRYVGQTTLKVETRFRRHIADARRGNKQRTVSAWLRSLNYDAAFVVLEAVTEADLNARERHWIQSLRNQGADLVNTMDGGHGWTAESRARLSAMLKGRPKSESHRRAMSEAKKRPDIVAKQIARNKQRFSDPAARAHMAERTRARFDDPAERQKVAEVNRKRFADPAARAHMSQLMKKRVPPRGHKLTPAQCQRRREVALDRWAKEKGAAREC